MIHDKNLFDSLELNDSKYDLDKNLDQVTEISFTK